MGCAGSAPTPLLCNVDPLGLHSPPQHQEPFCSGHVAAGPAARQALLLSFQRVLLGRRC